MALYKPLCLIAFHKASVYLYWSIFERKHRTDNYKTLKEQFAEFDKRCIG